jgi:hypothetical protein
VVIALWDLNTCHCSILPYFTDIVVIPIKDNVWMLLLLTVHTHSHWKKKELQRLQFTNGTLIYIFYNTKSLGLITNFVCALALFLKQSVWEPIFMSSKTRITNHRKIRSKINVYPIQNSWKWWGNEHTSNWVSKKIFKQIIITGIFEIIINLNLYQYNT